MEETKTNTLLKVTGIILIVGGILGILLGVFGILAIGSLLRAAGGAGEHLPALIAAGVLALLGSLTALIAGVLGVKYCRRPDKMGPCLFFGSLSLLLSLAGVVFSYFVGGEFEPLESLGGLVLPVLYLYAAFQGRKENEQVI